MVVGSGAAAHSWYDPECCSGRDCVPAKAVVFMEMENEKVQMVIDTDMYGPVVIPKTFTKFRPSRDENYHVCAYLVWVDGEKRWMPRCVYVPAGV